MPQCAIWLSQQPAASPLVHHPIANPSKLRFVSCSLIPQAITLL